MTRDFARLETHEFGQVLMTLRRDEDDEGRSGPVIALQISERHGVEPTMCFGPWPDTDSGWSGATKMFENADLRKIGGSLADQIDQAFGKVGA
ncbi:hypothetical protein EDC90_101827 [Martelella mediterranea]|uniref:Uncharacterized protein n=2 Tax=Martelella mediterranea TaxID=293089 RepID=A0A4R3NR64_9HYPH|nr:hypothetical protein EDC90_101827 [Martelella mediterranea]